MTRTRDQRLTIASIKCVSSLIGIHLFITYGILNAINNFNIFLSHCPQYCPQYYSLNNCNKIK